MPRAMRRKKVTITVYIEAEQYEQLKLLNERTRLPFSEFVRQGVDMILEKMAADLRPVNRKEVLP